MSSDNDKLCRNTEERIHLQQVKRFKKNKRIKEDNSESEEETLEDTLKIPEKDLDHTVYDNYTWMYCLVRKGKVKETEKSLEVRVVYYNRRFITIVCNYYCSAHCIPYPLIMRGDGVRGFENKVFLYEEKRLRPDFMDPHLDTPCIDLNELQKWGKKVVIFRDRREI